MSIYRGRTKNEVYLASLLYDAIEDLDLSSVKTLLIVKGADPNLVLPKKRISPFHLIIGNDKESFALEVSTLILKHGGNPNVQSDDGLTPVHIAAAWGRLEILHLLLQSGGDPEIRDICNKTPLHYAREENFMDCFNLLKLYLPDKNDVLSRIGEDSTNYDLILDKILVNNGTTVGEYEIVNEYKTESIYKKDLQKLKELPQSDTNEYVINWFNSQLQDSGNSKIISSASSTTGISEDSDESLKESDTEISKYLNCKDICFRKVYRKKVKTPHKSKNSINSSEECKQFSRESGIMTLKDDSTINVTKTSSDYVTCNSGSTINPLERNIFEDNSLLTSDETDVNIKCAHSIVKSEGISSSDASFVSVSEIYKYIDKEEGIVLFERRFLKTPVSDINGSVRSFSTSQISLPETIDYDDCDSEKIRKELTLLGYNPGPITVTTKRIYLKKLKQLKKYPAGLKNAPEKRAYSTELEKTFRLADWFKNVSYKSLNDQLTTQFSTPDPTKKWREGVNKSSFTYLLLDPRVTNNLPARSETLQVQEMWKIFLSAIFYVGKGKRSRPYSHLYDAVTLWNQGKRSSDNKKLTRILDIWEDNCGVVCLHLFQNTIPAEAYTREAAIISALKIENLCNIKKGDFYGVAATWTQKEKSMFGVFLLYKALMIFLNEGERQLCPSDID